MEETAYDVGFLALVNDRDSVASGLRINSRQSRPRFPSLALILMNHYFPSLHPARSLRLTAIFLLAVPFFSFAQSGPETGTSTSDQDFLLFNNGEKLIGKLRRSTGTSVVFHSNMAGDVTVDWSKIKELHSQQRFAVVPKNVNLEKEESAARIPQGAVSVAGNNIEVKPAEQGNPIARPLNQTAYIIDAATFDKVVLRTPAWYERWKGAATVGLSLVNATQRNQNYTSAVSLVRAIPGEDWMNPENRTSFNFTSSYGKLTQPNTPEIRTSIFHGDAERDHYFSPRLFLFGEATFDHDYSLGLDLEQTYGSGLGWTVRKSKASQVDVKAQIAYIDQMFSDPAQNQHLLSSVFSKTFNRKFENKITFHEDVSVSPGWSNLNAYSATGNVNLTVPVIRRLSYTIGVLDTFLNNPSPGFRKNSFQFSSGISYIIP